MHLVYVKLKFKNAKTKITKFGSDEEAALSKLMEEQDKKVAEFQELNENVKLKSVVNYWKAFKLQRII